MNRIKHAGIFWGLVFVVGMVYFYFAPHYEVIEKPSHFFLSGVDKNVSPPSRYPLAIQPALVGTYPADTESGAGYFYDDVLEYRVWLHPERGAARLKDGSDHFMAFAQFEKAEAFSKNHAGTEEPLVLVRQREWIDEPTPGEYKPEKGERITEWRVEFLVDSKRSDSSIAEFLKHPRPERTIPDEN